MDVKEKDVELVNEIKDNLKKAKDHFSKWRDDALTAYDFYAGNQWSSEDMARLRERGRPPIVFNKLVRVVNSVVGLQLQNQQDIVYTPRENNDGINAELLSQAAKWVRQSCDASDEEAQAFKDSLICGIGWVETHLSYETDADGEIIVERIDPLEMLVDPTARKRNFDDAKWVAHVKRYDKKSFKKMYPDVDILSSQAAGFFGDSTGSVIDADEARFYRADSADDSKVEEDEIEVVQYQYYELEEFYRLVTPDGAIYLDETGKSVELTKQELKDVREFIMINNLRTLKQYRRRYKQLFLYNEEILEQGDAPINRFSFRSITGLQDRNSNTWFGVIKITQDPQMYSNKWLSQILFILNSNSKGGYFFESDAIKSPSKFSSDVARPDANIELNPGGLAKIKSKEMMPYPAGIDRLMQYANEAVNELVGVNLEMLGLANRNQAGVLEAQRKDAGVTVLTDFFEALTRYYKEEGRVIADYIIEYISDGRLIKVVGQGMAEYVPLMRETIDFKYDIAVDETPSTPSQRQKTYEALTQIIPAMIQMGMPVPPEVLDYAPLPASLIEKWKQQIANKQPSEAEQYAQQIKAQLAELEVEYNQLKNAAIKQEMDIQAYKQQLETQKQEYENLKDQSTANLNEAKAQSETIGAMKDLDEMENNLDANVRAFQEATGEVNV